MKILALHGTSLWAGSGWPMGARPMSTPYLLQKPSNLYFVGGEMEQAKNEFLIQFGEDYGYPNAPKGVDEIRATEFKRLEGLVYLDHAGATLYSESQIEAVAKDLSFNVYGNPHSQSESSMATSDIISSARQQVLDYFNASPKEYKCIFTSGATAALKLVGETFPWSRESCYMYTMENHNSVLGIREYALDQGATAFAVDIGDIEPCVEENRIHRSSIQFLKHTMQRRTDAKFPSGFLNNKPLGDSYHLFAFPSECNFSGMKFPLDLIKIIKEDAGNFVEGSLNQRGRWMVLIDAAKGCATEPPDLARYPADFVVFSFYKIFGYPTGLGALIVRNEAGSILNKRFFSGGTVSASIADADFVKRRESIEQLLEDGTQSFLSIASIRHGFRIIETLTVSAIARHTSALATYVRTIMLALKHDNGTYVCTLYGSSNITKASSPERGPIISFNLRRVDGSWFGYREVEKLASLSGIQLRTGCFCNPGACAKHLDLSHSDLLSNIEAGHVCWDDHDVLHGKPTGAVRISFGYMSTFEDAEKFLKFLVTSFVAEKNLSDYGYPLRTKICPFPDLVGQHLVGAVYLKSITIYPVKSCAGFSVDSWPLSNIGLKYDREWLLKGSSGDILTQKKVPELGHIHTSINLEQGKLYLESSRCKEKLQISLRQNLSCILKEELDVYGQRYLVESYDDDVNMWFTKAIARPCAFVRCLSSKYLHCMSNGGKGLCRDLHRKLNFVNEAQLLLISEASVNDLNYRIHSSYTQEGLSVSMHINAMRFRPNLVVTGAEPYSEDGWKCIHVGKARFTSLGGCNRCQMINMEQRAGQIHKSREPLATLASYRRVQGKILFGTLLRYESDISEDGDEKYDDPEQWIQVGQEVCPSVD